MSESPSDSERLLRRAATGDSQSWGLLVDRHGERLRRMVAFRLDQRLHGRVDPSDVIQETYMEAWKHLAEYLRQPSLPFYLWLRGLARHKLRELHRHHLGAQMRDARREVSLHRCAPAETSSVALAAQLLGHATRPSEAAIQVEIKVRLQEALNSLDPADREVLALRHFEHLSPAETAQVLGIKQKAAGMRYVRALKRLKEILANFPGGLTEFCP